MLDRSPNLEDLRLSGAALSHPLIYPGVVQVIEQGRWPSFKRLTLSDLLRTPGADSLDKFINESRMSLHNNFQHEPAAPDLNGSSKLMALHAGSALFVAQIGHYATSRVSCGIC